MKHYIRMLFALGSSALFACSVAGEGTEVDRESTGLSAPELHVVGTTRIMINGRERSLPVQLWYPTVEDRRAEAESGHPVSEFEPPGERRALLEELLQRAPAGCTTRTLHAALDAPIAEAAAPYSLLIYSHHLEGMRIALFTLAEALAQHGFIVAAPDHEGRTLYDRSDDLQSADVLGQLLRTRSDDLSVRVSDVQGLLDAFLSAQSMDVPAALRGKIAPERVGLFGHSMGSITTGAVVAREPRVRAAAYIAFPPAQVSPLLDLFGQPTIDMLRVPGLFLLNQEDGALGAVSGQDAVRKQFDAYPERAHLVEVADTGHWSFADDCGLIPDFQDGCGSGTRQTPPYAPFEFLDNAQAREIAAHYLTEFFAEQFMAETSAAWSGAALPHAQVRDHAGP